MINGAHVVVYSKDAETDRKFFRDVVRLTISRGQLAKIIAKVSAALQQPYEELLKKYAIDQVLIERVIRVVSERETLKVILA